MKEFFYQFDSFYQFVYQFCAIMSTIGLWLIASELEKIRKKKGDNTDLEEN